MLFNSIVYRLKVDCARPGMNIAFISIDERDCQEGAGRRSHFSPDKEIREREGSSETKERF
jgi:hypothetical protein